MNIQWGQSNLFEFLGDRLRPEHTAEEANYSGLRPTPFYTHQIRSDIATHEKMIAYKFKSSWHARENIDV